MPDQTQAASSPAEAPDVFRGETPTLSEFNSYRETGELPERFKTAETAEPAPADVPEQTVEAEGEEPEIVPESDPETQEQLPESVSRKTRRRFEKLLADNKELQRKLEDAAKQGVKAEPPPVQQQQQGAPTPEDTNADGTPKYKTYEEFIRAEVRWGLEQELAQRDRRQAEQQALTSLQAKLGEARSRYDDADAVIFPAAAAIQNAQIPQLVKDLFEQSELFVDLCYVVGSDPDEMQKLFSLAQSNPRAAVARIFEYERGIREEFAKGTKAPEPKRTTAPKPPSPVGGGSSRAFDVSDVSLSAEEWMRKRNAQISSR